ncbi:MAG TPA: MiaB/RimO family radical SAM methylthiotransferase, partial [Candidatus Absconditabacterales bacterium]|nr:MiaB/RimO family radical SAM methylthiotransferase [Candidatus Absconditabacterales bacterium]
IPISTGCSQFCAYCIVPYARGLEKNRPVDEIIKEAEFHLSQGIEEIVLLGQIVNKHPDFVTIMKKILPLPGLKWLRYTSPYPTFYSPELLKLHETEEKLCPHIHMPLQSGSDPILKKMFRGYTAEQFKSFVDNIRNLKRPISITTDIIIGFPDETEEDFEKSLEMIDYAKFDMIYMGIYSPRPGTLGARKYPDNIPKATKKERRNRMNDRLLAVSGRNNEAEVNTVKEIIINKVDPDFVTGYTENMKTVIIKKTPENQNSFETIKLGHFLTVKIIYTESLKLFADLQH